MSDYIFSLSSDGATLALVGGKGVNLVALVRAGFPVPSGFIITTEAYRTFVETNHLQERIVALADRAQPDDSIALENVSVEIRQLFDQGDLPAGIMRQISTAYHSLTGARSPVAVRSSATAEDLPGLAFAGQQDTFLNVLGENAVLACVKACWGSLWTARAMAYRAHSQIPVDEVALAVVVQRMVPAESSGVLFTANPVKGRRDEMVVDASFGLGEAIVSGQVDPDHYVVDPNAWQITERKLGRKQIAIVPAVAGGTERIERASVRLQALADAQIISLAEMAQRVAQYFGQPQDIEWAWADGQLYLLQARPITSLYPLPENARPAEGRRVYVSFNSIQGVTDPFTPLGIDALRLVFGGVRALLRLQRPMSEIMPEAGGRLFLDFTDLMADPRLQNLALAFLEHTDPAARATLRRLVNEGCFAPRRVLTLKRAAGLLLGLLPVLRRVLAALLVPERIPPQAMAAGDAYLTQVREHVGKSEDLLSLLSAMQDDLSHAESVSFAVMPTVLPAYEAIPLVDRWLVSWLGERPGAALRLMRGLPGNGTIEMDLKLWAAAHEIRADAEALETLTMHPPGRLAEIYRQGILPAAAQRPLAEFLRVYGMRGAVELDLGRPRWRDDPTPILQTLLGYLQLEDLDQAPDVVYRRGREEAERLAEAYVVRARKTRLGWLRARLLRATIRRMRILGGLRETPLFYLVSVSDIYRRALLDCASGLVAHGDLESAGDIFFVRLDDLKRFAQGETMAIRQIAAANRLEYERECQRRQMPRVLLSTGEAYYEGLPDADASGSELRGEAVSPGMSEGRVHVILDPRGARLDPGEILVCPSTDPGWTPLFLTAGGLVMEIGGLITHGSVVAREFGIPAVVGVQQATTRLKTGQCVRVDGNNGRIVVLEG